jgi:cell division protein FtsB
MKINFRQLLESAQLSVIIAAIIGVSLIWSTIKAVQRNYELQGQVDALEEEIAVLELENQNLKLGIEYYKTDTFLELEARQKFNKAAPGEGVLLLPKDGDGPEAEQDLSDTQEEEKSNFEQWKYFLFGRNGG